MSIAAFVFLLLFFLLLLLDTELFRAMLKARAPEPVKDPSLSYEEQLLQDLKQRAENLRWLESEECRRARLIPGAAIWYYIRDHFIRRRPWKPSRSV